MNGTYSRKIFKVEIVDRDDGKVVFIEAVVDYYLRETMLPCFCSCTVGYRLALYCTCTCIDNALCQIVEH